MSKFFTVRFKNEGVAKEILNKRAKTLENFTALHQDELTDIVREGIAENFRVLERGGSMRQADGSSMKWDALAPRTLKVRARHGLGAHPILTLTGTMKSGVLDIRAFATPQSNGRIVFNIPEHVREKVRAHQSTGIPIGRPNGHMPVRPMIFWNKTMASKLRALAIRVAREGE